MLVLKSNISRFDLSSFTIPLSNFEEFNKSTRESFSWWISLCGPSSWFLKLFEIL
jgi:hypothetical protein